MNWDGFSKELAGVLSHLLIFCNYNSNTVEVSYLQFTVAKSLYNF